ncbi:isoprenylcysteine carboxyl methyltransferase family protein [Streptomyces sp. HMX112]|uniref:isoprenylcysteine carboxyl methyltransferase family protein n=1 Tax=Streptomyces sp. HMX112 TaxID=3390850 RepID=UPI003A806719
MMWYAVLVLAVGAERVAELVVARRNARWSLARGAVESGRRHYPVMVALHTGLLAGCLGEVWALGQPFHPVLGWSMLAVTAAAQGLRWWCVFTLGPRWNTRVLVLPGLRLVCAGPYRWLRHPNYVAVVAEGLALPLVHGAWLTATLFTVGNAALLTVRVRCEERALGRTGAARTPEPVAGRAARAPAAGPPAKDGSRTAAGPAAGTGGGPR